MVMTAKYRGTCVDCHGGIRRGDKIEWSRGAGARCAACAGLGIFASETAVAIAAGDGAPCWTCKAPGKFRNFGAATPIYCDACNEKAVKADRRRRGDCPTCGGPMSRAYAAKGYQCDRCADAEEGLYFG